MYLKGTNFSCLHVHVFDFTELKLFFYLESAVLCGDILLLKFLDLRSGDLLYSVYNAQCGVALW